MAGKDSGKNAAKGGGAPSEQDAGNSKDLREMTKAFENFRRDFREEMRELKKGVSYCTDICNDVKDIATEIKNLRVEMQELLRQNTKLKGENARLTQRCEDLEQYQRLNNLEIRGVPDGNDPLSVINRIGEIVGESIDSMVDIDTCHWVRTPKPDARNIVVRFVRRSKRNDLLSKCRKKKIDTSMLDLEGKTPIFVNEHLTPKNKALLSDAIKKKKAAKWKFAWTSGGKVLVRKDEGSDIIHIAHEGDLDKING
ncbi:hypothetical protein HPB49_006158 [Dermacentor silvarum]|uniref:Uncharacterized protein n=2 Tax=Dermacentor silvarum TaxID=543639 RepID=A0ACB8DWG3_DERSI|nr:hypothetical protein HPB49_006158 [Dermacentor silvarum]